MSATKRIKHAGNPSHWKGSLRWFFSEFIVVVSGILVALGLNAWYNSSREENEEEAYLFQLESELLESLHEIQRVDSLARYAERSVERLIYTYWEETPTFPDSVQLWLLRAHQFVPMEIRTGTISALITTGDIGLIKDDSLRNAILNYDKAINREMASFRDFSKDWSEQSYKLRSRQEYFSMLVATLPPATIDSMIRIRPELPLPLSDKRKQRFTTTTEELLADEQLYNLLAEQLINNANVDRIRGRLEDQTSALLETIQSKKQE